MWGAKLREIFFGAASQGLEKSLFQFASFSVNKQFSHKNISEMSALPPLSALAKFDDLMRCSKELTAGVAEESEFSGFLKFPGWANNKNNFLNFS